jgi:hypothetical protein
MAHGMAQLYCPRRACMTAPQEYPPTRAFDGAGDENRTRMTSLEGRDHCACRRAPSRPCALMTDLGLPTLAVLNVPLMAQAWFHCEPMTCKPSTSRAGSARHQPDLHIKARWQHRKLHSGVHICCPGPISTVAARAKPGAPELVHGLLETGFELLSELLSSPWGRHAMAAH